MVRRRSQTRRSNGEPAASRGRSKLVRVPSKYSVNCPRTRASTAPAGPRPSSSTHSGCSAGAQRSRGVGKNTRCNAVSEAARTSSPTGLGKRGNGGVGGGGWCPQNVAGASAGNAKGRPATPDGPHYVERPAVLQLPTELVAEPTMISPVVIAVPPVMLCRYTWIMFPVRPLLVTPSPEGICSFSTTYPTPGRLMLVFGATA